MFRRKKCRGVAGCLCRQRINKRLKHFSKELQEFTAASHEEKIKILDVSPSCFLRLICETGLNILKGEASLSDDQYRTLMPYKQVLLYLSKPDLSFEERKRTVRKKHFCSKVVPFILSGLIGFVSQVLARSVAE